MARHPSEIPGRALNAVTIAEADRITALHIDRSLSSYVALLRGDPEEDPESSIKVPRPASEATYLAGGVLSLDSGKLVLQPPSRASQRDSLYIDRDKKATIPANDLVIGRESIKTLSGLVTNPLGVRMPSTGITPQRSWVPSLLPVLGRRQEYEWMSLIVVKAMIYETLGHLFGRKLDTEESESSEVVDVGTTILDNSDLEQKILSRIL